MAQRRMSGLIPPTSGSDPHETLRWVRRVELVSGVSAIIAGVALWNEGWFHWLLIGTGLLCVSPWPGARAILRRAERDPGILVSDPERRRTRGRRAAQVQVPIFAVAGFVIGYVVDGLGAAIFTSAVTGVSVALGAWWFMRRFDR